MNEIPFTKAHGCGNDFLIVPADSLGGVPGSEVARAMCHRHFGVGADGLYLAACPAPDADAEIRLFNSDGSAAELSGNGTRCVAAWLVESGAARGQSLRIRTGAGLKELRLIARSERRFLFQMSVAAPRIAPGPEDTWSVWLGNPQCVVFVKDFECPWQERGRALGCHPFFPAGTNVDFVRVIDEHVLEARFWERGAGHTLASGTGSTAAAVAAIHASRASSPVAVRTEGGELGIAWEPGGEALLTGPAEITCHGRFLWNPEQ
jgi:diaminopimelate epimerase